LAPFRLRRDEIRGDTACGAAAVESCALGRLIFNEESLGRIGRGDTEDELGLFSTLPLDRDLDRERRIRIDWGDETNAEATAEKDVDAEPDVILPAGGSGGGGTKSSNP